jgi:hypothetical protein
MLSPCRRVRERPLVRGVLRWSGGNRFGGFCENELEKVKEFANLRAGDDEGRQEAQSEVVRAIYQQALTQGFRDEGIAVHGKLNAKDQAFTANFADERKFCGKLG